MDERDHKFMNKNTQDCVILIGYTEIVKIAEMGMNGNPEKVKSYMELFVKKYPNSDFSRPFKMLLEGNLNPDNLVLTSKSKNL